MRAVKQGYVGALGFDCVTVIANAAMAKALYDSGMRFAIRYLGSLSSSEIDVITNAGMAVMPVTYSRNPGWVPSKALGLADAKVAAARCKTAGIPKGCTVWLDLEGPGGTAQDVIDWVDAWATFMIAEGYQPGLYCGYATKLTSYDLYRLKVVRYWHSISRVTDSAGQLAEPSCGYCLYQLQPSVMWAGVWVDVNAMQKDYQARLPSWVVKA